MCELDESMSWKDEKCGHCVFWVEMQRPVVKGGAQDMSLPRCGLCRWGPPSVLGTMIQTPQGPALRTDGMYPPVGHDNPACGRFALNLVGAMTNDL